MSSLLNSFSIFLAKLEGGDACCEHQITHFHFLKVVSCKQTRISRCQNWYEFSHSSVDIKPFLIWSHCEGIEEWKCFFFYCFTWTLLSYFHLWTQDMGDRYGRQTPTHKTCKDILRMTLEINGISEVETRPRDVKVGWIWYATKPNQ